MEIYCLTCREHILRTSDEFVLGVPYTGNMFTGVHGDRWRETMFRQVDSVRGGDLHCPRCMGNFIIDGKLLTEHGIVYPGQESVDTSVDIVHREGEVRGILKGIIDSRPAGEIVEQLDPPEVDELNKPEFEKDVHYTADGKLLCLKCKKTYTNTERGRYWYHEHVKKC